MIIKFETKFSELQVDKFINDIYTYIASNKSDKIYFDLTEIEWISNQGLLLFTGVVKYLIEKKIPFEIIFIEKGIPTTHVPERVAKQIIQIWEIWGIFKIIPNFEYRKYLGIDLSTINSLKKIYNINFTRPEIFGNYGITPFVCLNYIENYDESIIKDELNEYHKLNSAIIDIIEEKNCSHPFLNNLFGEIISKEIYENFLDHAGNSFFDTNDNYAFFSLSLKGNINEEINSSETIQNILENNFHTEELPSSKDFFFDSSLKKYKNLNYVSYSFLDFGLGIPNTLKSEFEKTNPLVINDSEIIKFAFRHDSSRHPISNLSEKEYLKQFIPRGLFDIISLIQRYKGMLIVRSGEGKVLFNFSKTQKIEEAYSTFGSSISHFPGTFITIYLPALNNIEFDYSSIKPNYSISTSVKQETKFVSLLNIFNEAKQQQKVDKYNYLFKKIQELFKSNKNTLTFFDFTFFEERSILKKLIFYLVSSYEINSSNNVVILNPPPKEFIEELNYEILNLSLNIVDYKIHPLPFVFLDANENLEVYWLGIYDETDKQKLKKILFENFSLSKTDFNDPDSIIGHLNFFDEYGNLISNLPNEDKIKLFYNYGELAFKIIEVREIIENNNCISKEVDSIFFCNGNYYQKEFIELSKLLTNSYYCDIISNSLYHLIQTKIKKLNKTKNQVKFIAITSSSYRIIDSLINQRLINESRVIYLENYHSNELKDKLGENATNFEYVLICDVLATGKLVTRIENNLKDSGCNLIFPAVVVNAIDKDYSESKTFAKEFDKRIISLYKFLIKKFKLTDKEILEFVVNEKVIRINPSTNIPIRLELSETGIDKTLLSNKEFLDIIHENQIKVGFLQFNNIIHPYFFDTESIIRNLWERIFKDAFSKNIIQYNPKNLKIFYPKNSDIRRLDFNAFKSKILKNHNVAHYTLDRFITIDGWNFPHTSTYLKDIVHEASILILDDGSCSGDSLTQMINEVAFYKPSNIAIISIIGRIPEHKREFLSSLSELTKLNHNIKTVVYFISHWHIPTYHLNANPNIEERNWLKNLINLNNIPYRIRNIAKRIEEELKPISDKEKCNYIFLPVNKETGLQPKKDFIRVRNEIGKVIGFRFYVESFAYFDNYISLFLKTDKKSKQERVRETELLCAIIAYEPYLFEKLEFIIPDVTEKIKLFIKTIFFGNPSLDFKKIDISKLTYKWDKRDFLHIFFIIFKDFELVQLMKNEFLSKLINFLGVDGESIYYVLYKLLKFYPLTHEELKLKDSITVQRIIDVIISRGEISDKSKRELKIFRSFTNTLPNQGDFYSYQNLLREKFRKNRDGIYHKNSADSNLDSMLVGIEVLRDFIDEEMIAQFFNSWEIVSDFIEPILSFSKSFPNFFIDNLFILEGEKRTALRTVHGKLNKLILHLNDQSNFDEIEELLLVIQNKLLRSSSELYRIFSKLQSQNISEMIGECFYNYLTEEKLAQISNNLPDSIIVDFPEYYLKEIIFEEIVENLRYAKIDIDNPLSFDINFDDDYIYIDLTNKILEDKSDGGGNGLSIFEKANLYPDDIFKYKPKIIENNNEFNQKITLKRTKV